MSTNYDDAHADPRKIQRELRMGMKRCRLVARKGGQLLQLTLTERPKS